jgi:integrase
MATAKKLPSGNYRARVYDKSTGKTKSFTAPTKKEAEFLANEWLLTKKTRPEDITLDTAIDRYIESKSNTLSPSTIRGYRIAQRNAYEAIKHMKLDQITELTLQRWANENAARYSPKSINNQFGLLTAVFKQNKIRLELGDVLLKPREATEYKIPDKSELAALIGAISGKTCEIPVLIAMMCGLRQSEIAALRWEDYTEKGLHVHAAVVPDEHGKLVRKERPKSYAGNRTTEVPEHLKRILDSAERPDEYISPYRTPSGVLRAFQRVCEALSLPKYKMHELRHAYASVMLIEGVPDKYAMERLGQSTPHMIKQVYQHTFRSEQEAAAIKINKAFDKLAKTS